MEKILGSIDPYGRKFTYRLSRYGYRGNHWIRICDSKSGDYVHAIKVPDMLALDDITKLIANFDYVCDCPELLEYVIETTRGTFYTPNDERKTLPYGSLFLYKLLNTMLDLIDDLKLQGPDASDNHEDYLEELVELVTTETKKNSRMISLIKGTDIFEVLQDTDKYKTKLKNTETKLNAEISKNTLLEQELAVTKIQLEHMKQAYEELHKHHDCIISEKLKYKSEILSKLADSIKNM